MIQAYVLLGTLGLHSLEDIRQKKITVGWTLFSGIAGILLHLLFQNRSIFEMIAGMVPGVFVFAAGRVTNAKIGTGDGALFMLTGLYLGLIENLRLMFVSFLLAGIWGLYLLTVKKCEKTKRIPFVPFLFLGYCLMMAKGAAG